MPWRKYVTVGLFLSPALLIFSLFVFYPIWRVFQFSFSQYEMMQLTGWIGWDHYRTLLGDADFWATFLNSWLYLLVTPLLLVLSLLLALLVRGEKRMLKMFQTAYYLPVVIPMVVIGIAWKGLYNEDSGLINYWLQATGALAGDQKIHWLTQYPLNLFAVMGVTIWQGLGYFMVIFLAGLLAIPHELEEAAAMDGAGPLRKNWHIIIPLLKPSMVLVFILSSISALKVFTEIYIMISGAPTSNKTLVVYLYEKAFGQLEMGYASAMAVVLFLATLVFSYANLRVLDRGTAA
jgi:putative chitobiose transport system permease protein